jgi:hypothetical protein
MVVSPITNDNQSATSTANTSKTSNASNTDAHEFVTSMNKASIPGNGSPESAKSGTEAAKDLLSSNNPYFYNPLLFRTDRDYKPEEAKAGAFAATLYDCEQKGNNADIAQLLDTLGPAQAAQLFAAAGNLRDPQVNDSGVVFAQNQTSLDQVLSKALLCPGVQLGDGTHQGTLASSLLQQATQSGSNALSIAGILNGSATSTRAEALKNEFLNEIMVNGKALGNPTADTFDRANYAQAALTLINGDPTLLRQYQGKFQEQDGLLVATYQQLQQNANPNEGIFGSNGAGVPAADRGFLKNLSREIDTNLYGIGGQSNKGPATGIINPSTQYDIQQYLAGKLGNGDESPSQRLANMMSVLGPSRTYAVLADMTPAQAQQLGIQSSLNTLTDDLQLTAGDARSLALAQANLATSQSQYDFPGIGLVGSFVNSLPNDQNGTAVKVGYAQGCIAGARQLAQEIGSGKYAGQVQNQLTATLNGLCEDAMSLSTGFSDPVKEQLFSELHTAATQLAGTGGAKQSDLLNVYAANVLGSLRDKSQIAATLRAMGGVAADGAIDPNSDLAKFLQSALSGQSQLGIASYVSNMTPNGQMPQGVTSLLNGISASGDTKLMAGTLDTAMQWTIKNPTQAEVLASQDTGNGATGYRNALTGLLDKSFNRFVALDPSDPNATLVRTMQPQTIADLQALSAVEMGPPYDSKIAGNFAFAFGKHAGQFAAYAAGVSTYYPPLDSLLAGGGDPRNSAAVVFGQLMNGFDAGLNQSQLSFQAQAHDGKAAADQRLLEARVVTDAIRGLGTGALLASPLFGTAAGAVTVLGRIGLFTGSTGTFVLDAFFSNTDAKAQEQAVQKVEQGMQTADVAPTQVLQQMYDGWFSNISQLPGKEGQTITDGVMTGSSFAGAPAIETDVQNFYGAYNPMGYYFSQTGQYPSAS